MPKKVSGQKPYGRKYNQSGHKIKTNKTRGLGNGYMTKFIKAGAKK